MAHSSEHQLVFVHLLLLHLLLFLLLVVVRELLLVVLLMIVVEKGEVLVGLLLRFLAHLDAFELLLHRCCHASLASELHEELAVQEEVEDDHDSENGIHLFCNVAALESLIVVFYIPLARALTKEAVISALFLCAFECQDPQEIVDLLNDEIPCTLRLRSAFLVAGHYSKIDATNKGNWNSNEG